ncbi:DUF2169 family type VI secretion system accessory protein [Fundidesulfovibrio putealis]|uniref:DUF2169 family type VI secretion system accessory protein n=1 Tax=Fundidesulfovibrio putealis TaxID=270496 RepID=UPI00040E7C09|nr:DUF2169 domain-containing protein [Fundidesulfovibrio putealis]
MKILKEQHHSPMFLPTAIMGRMRLVCTVMVYFDLDDPESPLPDKDMWPQVMKLLPQPPVLDPGLAKPRAEVLLAGKCFAPDGPGPTSRQAAQVSLTVGGKQKTLNVFGDRRWTMAGGTAVGISDPAPFTEMPLTWERAFGGATDARNPKGRGLPAKPGEAPELLPNVEYPGQLISSPKDAPEPASFLPRDVMHPERQKIAGTYDEAWKTQRWPYYPDDLDPDFFLNGPQDQWAKDFFKGGEAIEIVNMHPKRQVIASRLPQFAVRLFLTRKKAPKAPPEEDTFEEVTLRRDTLWLFPEVGKGVIVFRGAFATERDDMADLRYAYMATEAMGETPKDISWHLEAQNRRVAAMKPVKPVIPDVNQKVNRELLKFNRVIKDIAQTKAQAMGLTPVMPREPAEIGAMGQQAIASGFATLDKMEAMARQFRDKFGWRAALDPASFASKRDKLAQTSQKIDQATAKAAQTKTQLTAMKADMIKDASARLKAAATPEQLGKAGIDPDNPLPEPGSGLGPWHDRGFDFVVHSRRNFENDPALMARMHSMGFKNRTLNASWCGYNPEPKVENALDWGLPAGGFTLPRGLVLPRFEGRKLTRILIAPDWPQTPQMTESGEASFLVPGSATASLWLAAPDEKAPIVVTGLEMEARLMEQEVGDVCHILALPSVDAPPPPDAAKALKTAPAVLVLAPAGKQASLNPAAPYLKLSDKAQWLTLPKGANGLLARLEQVDLRELVFDALPPASIGMPEDEPEPAFGPAPPKKRPAMPDIAGLVQAAIGEIRAFHEARFEPLKATMKDLEAQAREAMAKHGQDYDRIMADAKAAPRTPFDQLGDTISSDILAKRDQLKAMGALPPDKEADMVKAAAQAKSLGADSEARWQDGQKQLAEAAKKIEAAKAAPGGIPEDMKAQFKAAGMDIEAMVPRTRQEVIDMHAAGRSLSQAVLGGVDLSGLDLSGADFTGCRLAGTKFMGARLDGSLFAKSMAQGADFSGASLQGARFDQAMLIKTSFKKAGLQNADMRQASMKQADMEGADLSGANLLMASFNKANLSKAVFSGATLKLTAIQECLMAGAVLRETSMERVLIRKCDLSGADFSGALLASTQLQECTGSGVSFAKATFKKGALADCALPGCDFTGVRAQTLCVRGCDLSGSDFRKSAFSGCRIEGSSLTRANLRGVSARGTSFPGSDLEGADLNGADLLLGSLSKTRIVSADLRGANCFGVDFHKAVVGQTRFDGANLKLTALHQRADLLE